jgi:hypothetical protein
MQLPSSPFEVDDFKNASSTMLHYKGAQTRPPVVLKKFNLYAYVLKIFF